MLAEHFAFHVHTRSSIARYKGKHRITQNGKDNVVYLLYYTALMLGQFTVLYRTDAGTVYCTVPH